jgi:WD40 repeat protein
MKSTSFVIIVVVLFLLNPMPVAHAQTDTSAPVAVAWSLDGRYIVASNWDAHATILDVTTDQIVRLNSGSGIQYSVSWHPDSRHVAIGGDNGEFNVWEINSEGRISATQVASVRTANSFTVRSLEFSPDGRFLSSGSFEEGSRPNSNLWDTTRYTFLNSFMAGSVYDIVWHPDASRFATTTSRGYIRFWNTNLEQLDMFFELEQPAITIDWSGDGNRLIAGDAAGNIYIWNVNTGTLEAQWVAHLDIINVVMWNHDDSMIASTARDGIVKLWDSRTLEQIDSFASNVEFTTALGFSPFSGRLAFSSIPASDGRGSTSLTQAEQVLRDAGITIVVPAPSPERLQAITDACGLQPAADQALTAEISTQDYAGFTTQLEALPATALPPGCRADLLAVAAALDAQGE